MFKDIIWLETENKDVLCVSILEIPGWIEYEVKENDLINTTNHKYLKLVNGVLMFNQEKHDHDKTLSDAKKEYDEIIKYLEKTNYVNTNIEEFSKPMNSYADIKAIRQDKYIRLQELQTTLGL